MVPRSKFDLPVTGRNRSGPAVASALYKITKCGLWEFFEEYTDYGKSPKFVVGEKERSNHWLGGLQVMRR
jgi:hypothetical protein